MHWGVPRAAHLRILGGMRGFGLVSWGREFRKTGSLPDPSPREQHDGTAYPGRRFALPWAISFCPFGADGWGAALVLADRRLTHDGKEVPPSGLKRGPRGVRLPTLDVVVDNLINQQIVHRIPKQSNSSGSTS
jgi:hypothetical protein